VTLYIMVGLLAVGFICNLLVHQVDARHHHVASEGLESTAVEAA
jgi:uncharacterized membrane protein